MHKNHRNVLLIVAYIVSLSNDAISCDERIPAALNIPTISCVGWLNEKGHLKEGSIRNVLMLAYLQQKAPTDIFKDNTRIEASDSMTQKGYNTKQLFLVTVYAHEAQSQRYILKEDAQGLDEARRLKAIEDNGAIKNMIAPKCLEGLPSIALPAAYFHYKDQENRDRYLTFTRFAQGTSLHAIVMKFNNEQSAHNRQRVECAFQALGKETGNYHKLGMVHGDFHFYNLFFDKKNVHYTFIDNESMERSMRVQANSSEDLYKLFFMPFSKTDSDSPFRDLIKDIDMSVWHACAVKSFMQSYADTYSQPVQKLIWLKEVFNAPFTLPWATFDDKQLTSLREKHINPMFDSLISKNNNPI